MPVSYTHLDVYKRQRVGCLVPQHPYMVRQAATVNIVRPFTQEVEHLRKAGRGYPLPRGTVSYTHLTATNSIELSGDAKSFDRVARKWNVDYAFYRCV